MGGCAAKEGSVRVRPVVMRTVPDSLLVPEVTDQKNLESYYLIWLDSTVRSPEFIEMHDELRSIINYVKIFESNIECQREFEKITIGKIFLILNCVQGLSLLPMVHDHKQLHSIYVYHNGDNVDMEQAATQYKKAFFLIFDSCDLTTISSFVRLEEYMIRSLRLNDI